MPRGAHDTDYLEAILNANVYDVAIESPLHEAPLLSQRLGNRLLLKREDLQPVFSFKLRGAYNKMSRLAPRELRRGVVTASAGNHAQGVALAAQRLGTQATPGVSAAWGLLSDGRILIIDGDPERAPGSPGSAWILR